MKKKSLKVYYSLICEGSAEFKLFSYLKYIRFKEKFDKSNIQFSNKVQIKKHGISQGVLNGGAQDIKSFKKKYKSIKNLYKGQRHFFIIDKDIDDFLEIKNLVIKGGDIVQFVEYNSEYLLLSFAGKNPKIPSDFPNNLEKFRKYCKSEFKEQFKKNASDFTEGDFDSIFKDISEGGIKNAFRELFDLMQ